MIAQFKVHAETHVGRLLRKFREQRGLTQQDIAQRLRKPQSFVSKYESSERSLDVLEVRLICLALGSSLREFADALEAELGSEQ